MYLNKQKTSLYFIEIVHDGLRIQEKSNHMIKLYITG